MYTGYFSKTLQMQGLNTNNNVNILFPSKNEIN